MIRALCRYLHGGWYFDGIRCTACGSVFRDAREAGKLDEFAGLVHLEASRMRDREIEELREWKVEGYRVIRGGTLVPDESDLSGRRVMGGVEVRAWGVPPERKRAKPIPARVISLDRRTAQD